MDMNEFDSSGMLGDIPEAFRKHMGLETLDLMVAAPTARGATRLFICPSFEPIEAITLIYYNEKVAISHTVSGDDAWERVACGDDSPMDSQMPHKTRDFAPVDLPAQFQNWEVIADAVAHAGSCMSDNPDGIPYYHFAFGEGVDSTVAWFNPTKAANPRQCAMIDAYLQIGTLL